MTIIKETEIFVLMHHVESSNIAKIGYNAEHRYLRVDFKNGGQYCYLEVPENVWDAFRDSPTKGTFLAMNIKGSFECRKFAEPKPVEVKPDTGGL